MSGPFLLIAPEATLIVGLAILACFSRALSLGVVCLALAAAGTGTWRAHRTIDNYQTARAEAATFLRPPARCAMLGRILNSPTVHDRTTRFLARVTQADCGGRGASRPFLARLYGGPHHLRRGDTLRVNAQLGVIRLFRNHDLVDPVPFAARTGEVASGTVLSLEVVARQSSLSSLIDLARAHVRVRISETFAPGVVGLAKALVLGENDLTPEEEHSFKVSGLAHLLAVSGTHLIFAVVSVVMGARALLVRVERIAAAGDVTRFACAGGLALAILYADFAGGSGSAWRAAWMLSVGFGLRCLGREVGPAQCVAVSMGVGVVSDPLVALDLSFLLSLAATAGLMTCGRRWAARAASVSHKGARLLAMSGIATVASTIPCSLVLAPLATEVSLLGILANCLAAPFGEIVALPLCLLHALVAWASPLEQGLAQVASGALLVVRQVALYTARAEGYGLPIPYLDRYQYASAAILAVGLLSRYVSVSRGLRRTAATWAVAGATGFGAAEWRLQVLGHPEGQLRVTFLDVGQGDSTLIDLPDGSLVLVDGGGFVGTPVDPGNQVILPVLRARRRNSIDVVVVSHPHPDHYGGLGSVLTRIEVGELWDTGQGSRDGANARYSALLDIAAKRGVVIKEPTQLCGLRQLGGAGLSVYGPCPTFRSDRTANDNSFVLQFSYKDASVLLVGDAEARQERALLAKHRRRLRSTLLKVGHHGSRTSSGSDFLRAVQPEFAVVSCGIRNRFGHPHPEALQRLRAQAIKIWRVDERGSAFWAHPAKAAKGP